MCFTYFAVKDGVVESDYVAFSELGQMAASGCDLIGRYVLLLALR